MTPVPVLDADAWDEFSLPVIDELNRELARADKYRQTIPAEWKLPYDATFDLVVRRWWDVHDQAERLHTGSSSNLGRLDARWDDFIRALVVLELCNDCWGQVIEASRHVAGAIQSPGIANIGSQRAKATIEGFDQRLKSLKKDLEEAQQALTKAKVKTVLNFLIDTTVIAVGAMLGITEACFIANAAVTVGAEVVKQVADLGLNSKLSDSPDKWEPFNDVAYFLIGLRMDADTDLAEKMAKDVKNAQEKCTWKTVHSILENLGHAKSQFDLWLGLYNDVKDLEHVKAIVERIRKGIAQVERDLPQVVGILNGATTGELRNLKAAAELLRDRLETAVSGDVSLEHEFEKLGKRFRDPSSVLADGCKRSHAAAISQSDVLGRSPSCASLLPGERHPRSQRSTAPHKRSRPHPVGSAPQTRKDE